ncbi:MAG: hypothetical protein ACQERK_03910 [Campylobacterota bacterium]
MLKNLMYTSMGAALLAKERVYRELEGCREKNRESKEKARRLYEQMEQKGKEHEAEFKDELKSMIKEVIDETGLATKKDLQDLKK